MTLNIATPKRSFLLPTVLSSILALSSYTFADAVLSQDADQVLIERHLISLEGGRNFRDMGGIKTIEGLTIKPGLLFRAGVLHHLTDTDYRMIDALNIQTVVDFRDIEERRNEPTHWRASEVEMLNWDYSMSFGNGIDMSNFFTVMTDGVSAEAMMVSLYRDMVEQQRPHFQGLFQSLLPADGPILFHCTAGKDRTGIAAALIQTALGVERETVIRDYTLSETILTMPELQQSPGNMTAHDNENYSMLAMLPEEAVAALMGTRRAYLEAAFEEMTNEYGSVEAYIREGLNISDQDIQRLRSMYLQQ